MTYSCISGTGVQWSNIMDSVSVDDNFTLSNVLIMLIVDIFLCGIITWYVEAVFPGEFGIPQKWYFFVSVSRNFLSLFFFGEKFKLIGAIKAHITLF